MALWIGWAAGDVAVWTMQCIVTSRSCLLLGSPRIAGPSDSVTKKSELCHSVSLSLQERVTTPSCFIVVPLYACSMVCQSFLRSSLCWISVGGQFFGEHSAEYTERENVSLCSCVDLYSQGRRALVLDVQTGVKFVTVVTAVLLDEREFKTFQSAGKIIIAVVGDGVNCLAAMSGACLLYTSPSPRDFG